MLLLINYMKVVKNDVVYLVNAGNDPGMSAIANDYSFPALGVLALGTWLKQRVSDLEVIVRDGGVHSQEKILKDIEMYNPGLVGVSVLSTSYQNALQIAQAAKDSGALTVFGNDQAAQLSGKILSNRPYIDFVIGSEYGEESLEMLVKSLKDGTIPLSSIPHLTYRDGDSIKGFDYQRDKNLLSITLSELNKTKKRTSALDIFPVVDRTLFPKEHWDAYLKNYMNKFAGLHSSEVTGVSTMNRARGCSRQGKDICKHCDMLLDISFSSPKMFWEEAKAAYEQVGANVLYEVCDSFSSFGKFVKDVAKSRPSNLGFEPQFFVYAQARDLVRRPELAKQFKDMGVFRVNIGLESGSDQTLQHMKGPGDSVRTNYLALKLMKSEGIHVYGSLVLGTEAETPETLRETVEWTKNIIDERLVSDIEAQPILPLPNNYYGRKLMEKDLFPEGPTSDWPIDTDQISKLYVDRFSGVSYEAAVSAATEIRNHADASGINFGSGVSREDKYK